MRKTSPSVAQLQIAVERALQCFLERDFELLSRGVGETTCAHHLANYLAALLGPPDGLHVDVEFSLMVDEHNEERWLQKELPGLVPKWLALKDETGWEKKTGRVRPDIVLHRRFAAESNLLVIEVKLSRNRNSLERKWDRAKLEEFTKPHADHGLGYRLGAFIDLDRSLSASVDWFASGKAARSTTVPTPRGGQTGRRRLVRRSLGS